MTFRRLSLLASAFAVAPVFAQPVLIGLTGSPVDMAPDGNTVLTAQGVWRRTGAFTPVTSGAAMSNDGAYVAGNILNTAGVGGLPIDSTISGRFTVSSSTWANLGVYPNASSSGGTINSAYGISATGRFVVGGGYFLGSNYRAFLWDANTNTMVNLGSVAGDTSRANCISSDGTLIAGFEGGGRRPMYWYNRIARYVPGSTSGEVYWMNDAGTVMLGVGNQFSGHIVRWNGSANTWAGTDLGTIPAVPSWVPAGTTIASITPTSASQDGTIVTGFVTYFEPTPPPGHLARGAFLRTPALGVVDLRDYLASQGAVGQENFPDGYETATCISADGTKLAGWTLSPQPAWYVDLAGGGCAMPSIGSQTTTAQINGCSTTFLNFSAAGTAPLTYQWQKDNADIFEGPTPWGSELHIVGNSQLRIVSGKMEDVGVYTCRVTNSCGNATTQPITVSFLPVASNETCENAQSVGEGSFPFNMCSAYVADASSSCAPTANGPDLFFRYTPTRTGSATFSTCGSNFNSVLTVFDGCFGNELGCNDDDCGIQSRVANVPVSTGTPVVVRVALHDVNVTSSASGTLSITTIVRCVADVDDGTFTGTPDGGVTIDDLLYYLNLFEQGVTAADVDDGTGTGTPDGGVTIDDLLYYLQRFEAGC